MKKFIALALIAAGCSAFAIGARAEEVDYTKATYTEWYLPSQASIGAGATDPTQEKELSPNVTGELMFTPVGNGAWWDELRFRPTLGINANLGGKTSYGYGGATFDLVNFHHFFLDGFFGLSGNTGMTDPKGVERFTHKALGSNVLFRSAVTAGYQFAPQYALSAYLDHQSDAGIWSKINNGIETAGVRFSYLFTADAPATRAECCQGEPYRTMPQ
jgi:hypothetical protein